jgi:hypothetical protein
MAHSAAAAVAVHNNDDGRPLQDPMHEVDLGRPFKCAQDGSAHDERPHQLGEYPEWWMYQRDVLERTILFWDILRQRANNMLEHERRGTDDLSSASKARYTVADENIMTFADSPAGCWHR